MRLPIVIAGVLVGAVLGVIVEVAVEQALEDTAVENIYFIPLLAMMIIGAWAGALIARLIPRRPVIREQSFEHLPVCVAEFMKLVIKKMRYRKKVGWDVQAELAAHFEDELKDCTTDDEKEQKARRLIEDFGDVKLLGVLLRRAKKRCRPLWRTVVARTFQAIGVLILCLIIYVGWFFSGKPVITTDYVAELNRMVRPVADESLNAAPLYVEATELVDKLPDETKELLSKKYNEVTSEQKQLIEKWLIDNEEALELIIAGTRKPYYWREYSNDNEESGMMGILLPHLSDFRYLARALRLRAHLRAEQGRYEDAFDDIKACYRFGRHLRGDKSLIEQLVAIAIEALAAQTIRDILSEHRIDSPVLAELQQGFEQMIADEDCTVSFKFQKLAMYDEIQRCFTEDRLGGGHISLEGFKRFQSSADYYGDVMQSLLTSSLHILFTHPNKQQTRKMADRLYAFWDNMADKTPAQIRAENIDTDEETMKFIEGNILLEILAPPLGRVCELAHRNRIDVEAALTIIAILRYKQDVGDYPENLDELIEAGLLKALPIDPYSDQHLVYKRTDSDFVLYSLGADFDDDDGVHSKWGQGEEGGDQVFWPVDK